MKSLVNYSIKNQVDKKVKEFYEATDNPLEVQERILKELIHKASSTKWGRTYNYRTIKTAEIYRNRVPVQDYNSLKPLIDLSMEGKKNILWPGATNWFAKSSGTTAGKSKFIPVTKDSLIDNHFKTGRNLLSLFYSQMPDSKIYRGSGLAMGGSHEISKVKKRIRTGDLSAILLQNLPFWAKLWQQPSLKTALLSDWEIKIEQMALEVIDKNITHITGVPTWTIVLIKRLMEMKDCDNIKEIWPNLELYVHGGVSFTPYRNLFKKLIPDSNMQYLETYNASEGFFGIQDDLHINELLLLVDSGIYYEFIPQIEIGSDDPKVIGLADVELNTNYALVISTKGGLWRYMIGDTIKFTNLKPYRFVISGRTKNFINAFGEELIIENAEMALKKACEQSHAQLKDYTAAPVFFSDQNNGAHEWFIEFEEAPENIETFINDLDQELMQLNSDYDAKRFKNIALRAPIVHVVPQGTFYNWMKSRGKLGGQHKVPRLANNRLYADELKSYLNTN